MNELLAKVRTSLEREPSFVADASHELRTPFAVLQGELELAQRPGRTRDELMTTVRVAGEEVAPAHPDCRQSAAAVLRRSRPAADHPHRGQCS